MKSQTFKILKSIIIVIICSIAGWYFGNNIGLAVVKKEQDRSVITYYDNSEYKNSVKIAVAYWNQSGVIKFIKTDNKDKADLAIDSNTARVKKSNEFTIAVAHLKAFRQDEIYLPETKDNYFTYKQQEVKTIAHELGHIIGLSHSNPSNKCSVITPSIEDVCNENGLIEIDICGPTKHDIKEVLKLYPGRTFNKHYSPKCFFSVDKKMK